MSTTKNMRLAIFVKKLVDVIFWLFVGAFVLLAVWTILSPSLLSSGDAFGTSTVPVAIGIGDEPRFDVSFEGDLEHKISRVYVEEAQGILVLETTNWVFVLVSNLAKFLTGIVLAYFLHVLRFFLKDIIEGDPFGKENSVRVRKMGYLVLLLGFLRPVVEFIAANEILNQLPITVPALSPPAPFKAEVILASLLILILAQVWSYGLELEREKALTI